MPNKHPSITSYSPFRLFWTHPALPVKVFLSLQGMYCKISPALTVCNKAIKSAQLVGLAITSPARLWFSSLSARRLLLLPQPNLHGLYQTQINVLHIGLSLFSRHRVGLPPVGPLRKRDLHRVVLKVFWWSGVSFSGCAAEKIQSADGPWHSGLGQLWISC